MDTGSARLDVAAKRILPSLAAMWEAHCRWELVAYV